MVSPSFGAAHFQSHWLLVAPQRGCFVGLVTDAQISTGIPVQKDRTRTYVQVLGVLSLGRSEDHQPNRKGLAVLDGRLAFSYGK